MQARGPRPLSLEPTWWKGEEQKKARPVEVGFNDTFGQGDRGTEETSADKAAPVQLSQGTSFIVGKAHRKRRASICFANGPAVAGPSNADCYQAAVVFFAVAVRAVALACWAALVAAVAAAWKLVSAISTACLVAFCTDS